MAKGQHNDVPAKQEEKNVKKKCGIIMPISPHKDYAPSHWSDVLDIISEALVNTDFVTDLVSNEESIGLIHERIVTNIYSNEMIICDVSSKNPNVMFELGLRLAFDKPVVIIKDEKTDYSFDTSPIEHLSYPSSLRFGSIVKFKEQLKQKVLATYSRSTDQGFSSYLKSFNRLIVPGKIENIEVTSLQFIVDKISEISLDLNSLKSTVSNETRRSLATTQEPNITNVLIDSPVAIASLIKPYFDIYIKNMSDISNEFKFNEFYNYLLGNNPFLPKLFFNEEQFKERVGRYISHRLDLMRIPHA